MHQSINHIASLFFKKIMLAALSSISSTPYDDVRVLCWIMTSRVNLYIKPDNVKATWARHCNKFVCMSSGGDKVRNKNFSA